MSNDARAIDGDVLDGSRVVLPLVVFAALVALTALVGWVAGVPRLRELVPGRAAMQLQTVAMVLVTCAGVAARKRGSRRTTIAIAIIITLVGGITLIDYALHGAAGETALGVAPVAGGTTHSGRMAMQTGTCFIALGLALFDVSKQRRPITQLRECSALFAAFVGYVAIVGHALGVSSLWIVATTHIALNTAIAVLALAVAILLGPPSATFVSEIVRRSDGGYIARRLLPIALIAPVVIGWLRLVGEARGQFDTPYGAGILVVTNAASFAVSTWWVARHANALARDRASALSELGHARVEREVRARFVRTLAHDLRTPLSTIRAGAQRMSRIITDETEERVATIVVRGVARLDRMITDLLDAERVCALQPLPVHRAPGDASLIVQHVVDGFALTYDDRVVANVDRPLEGDWDASALERILDNLIGNALKYGDEGVVTVSARSAGDAIQLAVHNTGRPIRHEEIPRLLQPFERGSDTRGQAGWGIGLPLVGALCDAVSGKPEVESCEALGTTFRVTLPRRAHDETT